MDEQQQKDQNQQIGGLAGLGAGVLAGASAGTAVFPVIGTFAGAMIGGLLGNEVGKTVGGAILDTFTIPGGHAHDHEDVTEQLERLREMKEQGLLSEEEFKAAKARILGI